MFKNWKVKIISGGQTGVDRAVLDFALENNIPCGGWCPKGRKAEDGVIPNFYPLIETTSEEYGFRTQKNVQDSDGTLVLYLNNPDRGTDITQEFCKTENKPILQVILSKWLNYKLIHGWIISNNIKILNIAGPRESNEPGVYYATLQFLKNLFDHIRKSNS